MKSSTNKKLIINGPIKIKGEVEISGAKNSALPILASTLLTKKSLNLKNIPKIQDIISMLEALCFLNSQVCLNDDHSITINNSLCQEKPVREIFTQKTRASILLLGPLLARFGQATIAYPGGCKFGERPIDLHINSLRQLGARIELRDNMISAAAPDGLIGGNIKLSKPSVGATENIIVAATLAQGVTRLQNCAMEPEIDDLISFLVKMGAKIKRLDAGTIEIQGVKELGSCNHTIIGDRIEAGTYLIAAAATQGSVITKRVNPNHLSYVLKKLTESGAIIKTTLDSISLSMPNPPKSVSIETMPFPGFPTDLQAQWVALNIIASEPSSIVDTIYETRISHVSELQKLGAQLALNNNQISSQGRNKLKGAHIQATDIRASAGLIIASLCALGETHIHNTDYIDRGYVSLEEKFRKLGAQISRTKSRTKSRSVSNT